MRFSPKNIGPNLERMRVGAELTRTDLAKEVGISRQFLTLLETGEKVPSVDRLAMLCHALQCEPNDLMWPRRA